MTGCARWRRRILKALAMFFCLGGAFLIISHKTTRYVVEREILPDGSVVFRHEDEETTQILNYLARKEDLSREMKFIIAKNIVAGFLEKEKLPIPEKIWDMDEFELKELCAPLKDCLIPAPNRFDDYDEKDWFKKLILPVWEYNEKRYRALWELEAEVGSPKIRWKDRAKGRCGSFGSLSYYNFVTNTICLDLPAANDQPGRMVDSFIGELAHSKQHNDKPLITVLRDGRDNALVLLCAVVWRTSFRGMYERILYNTPNTLEHEAHKIIGPELSKKVFN